MPLAPGRFSRYCCSQVRKWGQTKNTWVTDKYEKRWKEDKTNKIQYDCSVSTVSTYLRQELSVAHSSENSCRWNEYLFSKQPWFKALVCIIIVLHYLPGTSFDSVEPQQQQHFFTMTIQTANDYSYWHLISLNPRVYPALKCNKINRYFQPCVHFLVKRLSASGGQLCLFKPCVWSDCAYKIALLGT